MAQPIKPAAKPIQSHGAAVIDMPWENHPSNNLWIGNVSPDVSDSELKVLFESHGEVLSVNSYPSRNYAFVYFKEIEGAKSARQGLQGHVLRGNRLKIEYAKPAKPCNSLWVARISQSVTKEELEKEFLKFGTIQEVRFLRDRNTACIDYIRLEDAIRALKSMNGKRIGGDQIRVDFLRSQSSRREQVSDAKEGQFPSRYLAPSEFQWMADDSLNKYPEPSLAGTQRQNQFLNIGSQKVDIQQKPFNDPQILIEYSSSELGHKKDFIAQHPGAKAHFREFPFRPVQMDILGLNRPVLPARPPSLGLCGPHVYMRPPFLGPHSTFKPALPGPKNPGYQTVIGGPNWSQLQRESERSRLVAAMPPERTENQGGFDENYGLTSQNSGGASGSLTSVKTGGLGQLHSESNCIWRGIIAKAGTPVCHARCVPVGEGIDAHIPEVINCSARTGLDLLSKNYGNAIGFNIVFFLPDSEEDFASYTEFLRYLVSKDRAAVSKFDDGTTLFLVPPSDFLTKVLNVPGPERLYGVVLKFPILVSTSTSVNRSSIQPQYGDPRKKTSLQTGYCAVASKEMVLPEDSKMPLKAPGPVSSCLNSHSLPPTAMASQPGFVLTPELIKTLTSLLPSNNVSSGSQNVSLPRTSSMLEPTSNPAPGPNIDVAHWKHEHQALDHNGQLVQHLGDFNSQVQHSYSQMHERLVNLPPQRAIGLHQRCGTVTVTQEMNQHQQFGKGSSQDISWGQGTENGIKPFYSSSNVQQVEHPVPFSNQLHGNDVSKPQPYMLLPSEVERKHQSQQLRTGPHVEVQERTETEADKIERYKTTLLFAANLLSRIHQPPGNRPGQGMASQ
ncbi:hypothetical protein Pfo_016447 [Paulownia fortunei]|nr:hypothetical protein Pfo_016447 [Paulownia fortunei]